MSERGRPRKGEGAVYQRRNSEFLQVRYRDQKGEIIRESAGTTDRQTAELPSGPLGRTRRGAPHNRSEQQTAHNQPMGRLASGAAIEAANPKRWQSPAESQRAEVSAARIRGCRSVRHNDRGNRELSGGASRNWSQGAHQVRPPTTRQDQAGNCTPGVPNLTRKSFFP